MFPTGRHAAFLPGALSARELAARIPLLAPAEDDPMATLRVDAATFWLVSRARRVVRPSAVAIGAIAFACGVAVGALLR